MNDEKWFTLALKYLQRRPMSEKEIGDYLKKKNAPADVSLQVVIFLKEKKFLDDVAFASWWIDQRTRFRQKGKFLIEQELLQKGVSRDTIAEAFANTKEEILSDLEKAKIVLQKKKEKFIHLSKHERYQKAGSYLARRGFDTESIRKSIDEIFSS